MSGMEKMLEKMIGVSIPDIKKKAEGMVADLTNQMAQFRHDIAALKFTQANHDGEIADALARIYTIEQHLALPDAMPEKFPEPQMGDEK